MRPLLPIRLPVAPGFSLAEWDFCLWALSFCLPGGGSVDFVVLGELVMYADRC